MRSGELARLCGVSPDTLRHYERLGILPKPPRTSGGYRDYPTEAAARVRLVRSALSVGFSLPELATLLRMRSGGQFPCRETRRLAESKLVEVKRQLKGLKGMRGQLESILSDWDARLARTAKGQPAHLLETLPDRLSRTKQAAPFPKNQRSKSKP
ncbi:MAG: heavy metal-responsive transcriptional regulator [Acidobacteriia bacterium]|nr:heavy metal-responsive transcriptional regulator [Terriglobia bacterium]